MKNIKKNKKKERSSAEEIMRLASFTKLNPRPIVEMDMEGNIVYQNSTAKTILSDLGKNGKHHEYFSDFKKIVTILKNGEKSFNRDIKIQNKWFRQFFYHMPDFNSVLLYGSDISERKRAEENLKRNEKRYRLLFEKMNYGYALQDIIFKNKKPIDYRFIDVNPAFEKISKLKKEQIIGKTANEISTNPRTKESIESRKKYDRVAITGKPLYLESYNEKSKKYLELYAYKPNENQIALIFSDITNRKKTDEEKNNFISIMSHELRNPLTPILANAQFIKSLLPNQKNIYPTIKESVDVIEKQAKMMADLLNDILDVSRLSRHKIQLNKSKVNICELVKNSVATSMSFINTKKQKLSVFFGQDPIYMQADPVRIEQILINIINNASKYTKPRGNIEIHTGIKNNTIEIRVKDNGEGMTAEKISRIFDLFSDESQPFMGIGGLGIGLNIVKNLVKMHGGTISVVSEGKNKGSEFIINFPCSKNQTLAKKPARKISDDIQNKYSKVLIVEDNASIREALSKILHHEKHFIRATHSGLEAVKISKSFNPDVALVDIGLPDINGYKVAKILKEQYKNNNKKIKLIAFTGYGQQKDKKLAKEAGFDHYLIKPIDIKELIKLI